MHEDFDELKKLIDFVQTVYSEITNVWLHDDGVKINLKKSQVADIDDDGVI